MQIDQYPPPMYMYSCLCCLLRMRDVYRAGVKGHKFGCKTEFESKMSNIYIKEPPTNGKVSNSVS